MCLRRRLQANVVTPSLFRMLMLMFCVFPYCFLPFSAFTAIFGVVVLDSTGDVVVLSAKVASFRPLEFAFHIKE